VADWLTRYRRYSADRLSGMLRWAAIATGVVVAVTIGGNLVETWALQAPGESANPVIHTLSALGVALAAGAATTGFFIAFILVLYLITAHLAERSECGPPPNTALQLTPRAAPHRGVVAFWRRGLGALALAVSARGAAERPVR